MGVIRKAYNIFMTLIGLAVICIVGFFFVVAKWSEYQDEKYAEDREEIAASVAEAARERGLGDLADLRQDYLARCPVNEQSVFEGNAAEICAAMADALLAQSQKREMTLSDVGEIGYELCALDARSEDEDPDEYCNREDAIDDTLVDALALGLCAFDSAWIIDPIYENNITKRGAFVYVSHERHVDCNDRVFKEWYYEGFFDDVPEDEDDEGPELLSIFYEEQPLERLHEVLERNGGKVNLESHYYSQPLSIAIESENAEAALTLLEAGADPTWPYDYGQAPIVQAAGNGMLDVVKALVAKGADVNGVVGSESLNFAEPLMWAAMNSHERVALWLLDNGATIAPDRPADFPNWSQGRLLEYAVEGGDLEVIQRLVRMGATSDDTLRVIQGAIAGGNADVLALIFDTGYELPGVKYYDRIYDDVVDVIQEEGRGRIEHGIRMFELLLEQGLAMSELSDSGWNYAHQAVIHYAPPTIRMDRDDERAAFVDEQRLRFVKRVIDEVLAAGVAIDHRYESQTLLMEAADGAQVELVRYLLEKGADPALTNDDGELALDVAVREGRRLTSFWDDNEALKRRFTEVVEILGGSPAMLDVE
ncbi:MAG: hypothetical protein EX272_10720 [Chromatiales bacterium]|nr:MAG: hypothetical protein EX272_10720 [Chromatiales bacterium]